MDGYSLCVTTFRCERCDGIDIGFQSTGAIFFAIPVERCGMRDLDETDMEILRLLGKTRSTTVQRNRRGGGPLGPAVSDRVERLEEAGVIEGFTVDVDQSQLRAGIPVFVQATVPAADVDDCKATIADADAVEHVFVTADGECWFYARAQVRQVREWLQGLLPDADGVDYDVTLVDDDGSGRLPSRERRSHSPARSVGTPSTARGVDPDRRRGVPLLLSLLCEPVPRAVRPARGGGLTFDRKETSPLNFGL